MTKLLTLFLIFLLIKAVLLMLPRLIRTGIRKCVPYKKYTAEEVIACKYIKPDVYYSKQLKQKGNYKIKNDNITLNFSKADKDLQLLFLKEMLKHKIQNKQLSRSKILAIRNFLELNLKTKEENNKRFENDFHAIYHYLKSDYLTCEHIIAITNLLS